VARTSAVQDLSPSQLKRLFTNESDTDSSGPRDVPFNHPPHTTERVAFEQTVLGVSADEVSQFLGRAWPARRARWTHSR